MRTAPMINHDPIPWDVHARIWERYAKKWSSSQSAERLAERGGFHPEEADILFPEWRDMVGQITDLRAKVEGLEGALEEILKSHTEEQEAAEHWEKCYDTVKQYYEDEIARADTLAADKKRLCEALEITLKQAELNGTHEMWLRDARAALNQQEG